MVSTQRIALALGLVLSGLGCGDPEPEDSGGDDTGEVALGELTGDLLMIAQVAEASVLFADYPSGTVVGERCLSELVPEECSGEPGFTCLLFEIEHHSFFELAPHTRQRHGGLSRTGRYRVDGEDLSKRGVHSSTGGLEALSLEFDLDFTCLRRPPRLFGAHEAVLPVDLRARGLVSARYEHDGTALPQA